MKRNDVFPVAIAIPAEIAGCFVLTSRLMILKMENMKSITIIARVAEFAVMNVPAVSLIWNWR